MGLGLAISDLWDEGLETKVGRFVEREGVGLKRRCSEGYGKLVSRVGS